MRQIGFGASLALCSLIWTGCQTVPVARLHLPEPPLPACLVEEAPEDRQAVGAFQFSPTWMVQVAALQDKQERFKAMAACAGDIAKALREGVGTIRLNNRP